MNADADVIRAIRKSSFVNHLIYVSCKPTAAIQNITELVDVVAELFNINNVCAKICLDKYDESK